MAPLFVCVASPLFLKEKLTDSKKLAVVLAFIGMYFIVDRSTVNGLGLQSFMRNNVLGMWSKRLLYALVVFLATKFLRK